MVAIETVSIIAMVGLALGQYTYQEIATKYGSKIAKQIATKANQLNALLAKNSTLATKIQDAYSSKNNNLLTALLQSSGFGNIRVEISKKMKEAKDAYNDQIKAINDNNAQITNAQNSLQAGQSGLNTWAGNISGQQAADDVDIDKITSNQGSVEAGVNAAIQGGLK